MGDDKSSLDDLIDSERAFRKNTELMLDTLTESKLHSSAMEEGIWLGNLFERELMPEPEQRYLEYTEADAKLASAELLNQWREASVNEPKSTLEALDAVRKERSMTGRFTANNPPPSQPPNRMRAPSKPSGLGNSSPQFGNSLSISAYSPAYYNSATTEWKRISAVEFEQSIYKQIIVRAPDFDRPHEDATLAVIHLSNGIKLAIQLRAWDGGHVPIQRLHAITRSKVPLSGRLGLQSYQQPTGSVSLDLIVQTSTGPHTIARTHTEVPDWVLGFYKETR